LNEEPEEPLVSPPEPIQEFVPPPVSEPIPEPSVVFPPPDTGPRKIDELDESLLPKGFKAETALDNMRTAGSSETDPNAVPDFSQTPQATTSSSAVPEAFEESNGAETPVQTSEPLPAIDIDGLLAEISSNSERIDGISPTAADVLGPDFDFDSLLNPPSFEPAEQELVKITDLNDDAYRIESGFLQDATPIRESTTDELIETRFPEEMFVATPIKPEYSADQVFPMDSAPMLPLKKANPT
jgi:hypothetical protein